MRNEIKIEKIPIIYYYLSNKLIFWINWFKNIISSFFIFIYKWNKKNKMYDSKIFHRNNFDGLQN